MSRLHHQHRHQLQIHSATLLTAVQEQDLPSSRQPRRLREQLCVARWMGNRVFPTQTTRVSEVRVPTKKQCRSVALWGGGFAAPQSCHPERVAQPVVVTIELAFGFQTMFGTAPAAVHVFLSQGSRLPQQASDAVQRMGWRALRSLVVCAMGKRQRTTKRNALAGAST